MTFLAPFLLSLAGHLTARVLFSLGMGFVSYAALTIVAQNVATHIQALLGTGLGPVLSFIELGGFTEAIGIILGGVIARATLGASVVLQKLNS